MNTLPTPNIIKESLAKDFGLSNKQWVFGQVATQSTEGPHIRTMRLYDLTDKGELIFMSRTDTLKCRDLLSDPRITVCLFKPDVAQITVNGKATLFTRLNNPELIESCWNNLTFETKEIYRVYEKDSSKEPIDNLCVIVITPESWEIIKLAKQYLASERLHFVRQQNSWEKRSVKYLV